MQPLRSSISLTFAGDDAEIGDVAADLLTGRCISGDAAEAARVLLHCSVVVGLHPDQALDACVDLALALGTPFAVVPCCVYAEQHMHRRLADGAHVRAYEQLLEWVTQRAPGCERVQLPMAGKNLLLFWPGRPVAAG